MDRRILSRIDEELDSSEVAALCFLCHDVVSRRRLEGIKDAKGLFLRLEEKGLLQNDVFLRQLLHTIGRQDLVKILGPESTQLEETDASPVLSNYRMMLYAIYQDLTKENLAQMKFLLSDKLGRKLMDSSNTALDVFAELEMKDFMSDTNVNELHKVLLQLDQELAMIVQKYMQGVPQQQSQLILGVTRNDIQRAPEPRADLPTAETHPIYVQGIVHTDATPNTGPALLLNQSEYYAMTHKPRGLCAIFNNETFIGYDLKNRRGTRADADALSRVFTRLGFTVEVYNDLTAINMLTEINRISERNFINEDALVVCVLSHGEKGCVFGTDERKVLLEYLTQPFTSERVPTLAGKPKLFFIQACQGEEYQKGYLPCPPMQGEEERDRRGSMEEDAGVVYVKTIPEQADFLLGMATVPECKSFRNTVTGSIYIQELCSQLLQAANSQELDDILSVLTRVNRNVSQGEYLSFKQMPEPKYTLTKKVVFKFV